MWIGLNEKFIEYIVNKIKKFLQYNVN